MKRIVFSLTAAALFALLPSLRAGAQEMKSAYFLDDYVYKYEMNPAMHDAKNTMMFVGFGLNDIGINAQTNLGVNNFLFPMDGQLLLFLNDRVPRETFLAGIPEVGAKLNVDFSLSLLSFGFKVGKNAFLSFDTRLRSAANLGMSKDFLAQIKPLEISDRKGTHYQFESMNAATKNYLEQAIGCSFEVAKNLRLGFTLKGLFGLAAADVKVNGLKVDFIEDEVAQASATTEMYLATTLLAFPKTADGYDFEHPGFGKVGISGYGGAVDLGISWESDFGLDLSAAVLDLGAMMWNKNLYGQKVIKDQIMEGKNVTDYVNQVFAVQDAPLRSVGMLTTTVNACARYHMPFYKGLSVGVQGTYAIQTKRYDVRAGLTISPARWFSLTANYGWTDYGGTFGAAMNLRPGPFTFFVGAETCFYKFTPQGLPIGALNTTAKLGVLISVKTKKS